MNDSNRLGILLSGRGSNFAAIHKAILDGRLQAQIACVVSNQATALGLARAQSWGYESRFLDHRGRRRRDFDAELAEILRKARVDVVCLAGYMRLLSTVMLQAFPNHILNIHPSLLPAFPGLNAQRQALDAGAKVSGCTVHFVDEGLDSGPIILQAAVPILDDDSEESLAARILVEEHRIYSEAIQIVLKGHFRFDGRRVIVK